MKVCRFLLKACFNKIQELRPMSIQMVLFELSTGIVIPGCRSLIRKRLGALGKSTLGGLHQSMKGIRISTLHCAKMRKFFI